MSIEEQINKDIKEAMLAKDKLRLTALRAVKAAFLLEKTKVSNSELLDDMALKIMRKMVKQRLDSAEIFKQQKREELSKIELDEAGIIKNYLPAQLSTEELRKIIGEIIKKTGAESMKDMGKVMGVASNQLSDKADGKQIAIIVKELLG